MKQLVVLMVVVLLWGCAAPPNPPAPETTPVQELPPEDPPVMPEAQLSPTLQTEILAAVAQEQNRSPDQLEITTIESADWPDACLGLAQPDEFCAQMITPGWAIAVTDGETTWQYRTDLDGLQIRAETSE